MVTWNLPFGPWGEVFGDEVVAAAMIDRRVHDAEVLTLAGASYCIRARRELLAEDQDKPRGSIPCTGMIEKTRRMVRRRS